MKDDAANEALETFVRDREKLILAACRIVDSRAVAEELVQDSWLRWRNRGYPADKAEHIFRRIVRNLALDWRRRSMTERQVVQAQVLLQDTSPDSERILSSRQELRAAVKALEELPGRTLRAFRLHRIHGRPYAAIAEEMSISPSTAFKLVEDAMVHVVLRLQR